MPKAPLDNHDWLRKHLEPLMRRGQDIAAFDDKLPTREPPSYDRGYWTGLKLVALKYYLPAYLNILARRMDVAYVDLFAGPGLDRIGDRKVPLPGSPLLPMVIQDAPLDRVFSHFILCEQNKEYSQALLQRARAYLPHPSRLTVVCEDANSFVQRLADIVSQRKIGHCLVFVDPEGLEWSWTSMECLTSQVNCDVIMNFPSSGLQRISTKSDQATRSTVCRFLGIGDDQLPAGFSEQWALETYRTKLAACGKDISTEIKITDSRPFHYHLIPAVRRTPSGSPWFRALLGLRNRIDQLHGGFLDLVAQEIDGLHGTLI